VTPFPPYYAIFTEEADAFMASASKQLRRQIGYDVYLLQLDPRRTGVKKIKGSDASNPTFRFRSGDYRILFQVDHGKLFITIDKIDHRRQVYR
jgi:mRNA interferase RelE/StbE